MRRRTGALGLPSTKPGPSVIGSTCRIHAGGTPLGGGVFAEGKLVESLFIDEFDVSIFAFVLTLFFVLYPFPHSLSGCKSRMSSSGSCQAPSTSVVGRRGISRLCRRNQVVQYMGRLF
jgi:hypothetical protein